MEKPFFIEHRMKLADEYEASGKYLHALQIYKSISEADPEYSEAVIKTAGMYKKTGNVDAAYQVLNDYMENYPENTEARFYLGELLLDNLEWDKAIEILSYFNPGDEPLAAFFTGYAYFMQGEFELAKINFNNFILQNPQGDLLFESYFFIAKIEVELNDFQSALMFLKKAEPALGNFWEFNYISALSYFNIGMYAHAVSFAERSISLNSQETAHFKLAGRIYLKLGDYIKAEKYLRKYIANKDNVDPDTYSFLAEACMHTGKMGEAVELYDKTLTGDPMNKAALDGKKNAADLIKKNSRVSDG